MMMKGIMYMEPWCASQTTEDGAYREEWEVVLVWYSRQGVVVGLLTTIYRAPSLCQGSLLTAGKERHNDILSPYPSSLNQL